MAFLQYDETSGRYRIRFDFGSVEYKRSIKTKDRKTALGIQGRVEETIRLLEQGRLEIPTGADPAAFILSDGKLTGRPVVPKTVTLGGLIERYQQSLPAGTKEANSLITEQLHCKHLIRILASKRLCYPCPRRTCKPIARGGLSPVEQRELWDCLFLTRPQVAEVLAIVKAKARQPFLYPMFVFAADTGARRSEMMRSRIEDFDFEGLTVLIREKKRDKTKRLTFRRVPMSPLLTEVFAEWLARHPGGAFTLCRKPNETLRQTFATKAFRRCLKGTKWVRLRGFHAFRHSFASNLAATGIDQRIIDEFMGHQTEAMRRRYRHLFPEQRRKAIETVYG